MIFGFKMFKTFEENERKFHEGGTSRFRRVGENRRRMKLRETEGVPRSGNSFNPVSWSQDLAARQLVAAGKSKRTHLALWYHNPNNHYYCRYLLNPKPILTPPRCKLRDLLFVLATEIHRASYRKFTFLSSLRLFRNDLKQSVIRISNVYLSAKQWLIIHELIFVSDQLHLFLLIKKFS